MPFNSDARPKTLNISLNVSVIHETIQAILNKKYIGDITRGSLFWKWVCDLEKLFTQACNSHKRISVIDYSDWFLYNYKNVYSWNTIKDNFIEDPDCEACQDTGISYWSDGVRGNCLNCELQGLPEDNPCYKE